MAMTTLLGFTPDIDPFTPGAVIDCTNVIPGSTGMEGAPVAVSVSGVPVLAAACRGAAVVVMLNGTRRILAGTSTRLYELIAGVWTDLTHVAGVYALGADDRWDFAQYGDSTLVSSKTVVIQRSTGSGVQFVDMTAPKATTICVAENFVVAFNTDDPTNGDDPDRWQNSALLDETDWVVSVTTQANTGRLVSIPGPIVACEALGAQVAVYKERGVYLGRYTGTPDVWTFERIPTDVGALGFDAVVTVGAGAQIYAGRSDIMFFDGTRPVSLMEGVVKQWWLNNLEQSYAYKTQLVYDAQNTVLWVFFPSVTGNVSGSIDSALVYHLGRKKWGRCTQTVECVLNYISAGITIDQMDTPFATIENASTVSFDSQFWLSGGRMLTVFNSSHQLCSMTGSSTSSSMTLFDLGDDQAVTTLKRVRVGYQTEPTTGMVLGTTRMSRGGAQTDGPPGTFSNGKYDIRQTGRFHRVSIAQTGDWVADQVDFDLVAAGQR